MNKYLGISTAARYLSVVKKCEVTHAEDCVNNNAGDAEADDNDQAVGGRLHVLLDSGGGGGLEPT